MSIELYSPKCTAVCADTALGTDIFIELEGKSIIVCHISYF